MSEVFRKSQCFQLKMFGHQGGVQFDKNVAFLQKQEASISVQNNPLLLDSSKAEVWFSDSREFGLPPTQDQ